MNRRFAIKAAGGAAVTALAATLASRTRLFTVAPALRTSSAPPIEPGPRWNGKAGSGFAAPPRDPVRKTAKPALRMLVPPRQAYTDELLVGVFAGANFNGTLLDNMGLEKVTAHYEGRSVDILKPGFETFDDVNGNAVTYFGWWIRLRHNGTHGEANLYFEAVPKDPAMQRRTEGPFSFLPSEALYDFDVTIDPDAPEVEDVNYRSAAGAISRFGSDARHRGRLRFVTAGTYDIGKMGRPYKSHSGWLEISADVPGVVIGKTAATKGQVRPQVDRIRFRGRNLTLDMRFISQFRPHSTKTGGFWFDGCTIVNSAGRNALWDKRARDIFTLARNRPFYTECTVSGIVLPFASAALVRGCHIRSGASDFAFGTLCLVDNRIDDWSSEFYKRQIPGLAVHYVGGGRTATISISGNNGAPMRTWTAKVDGKIVGTFTVQNADPALPTYNVGDIANWLNTLEDWRATLLDDTRDATHCGPPGVVGTAGAALVDQDVKSAPWTAVTIFDFHVDWWQKPIASKLENVVIANNVSTRLDQVANIFINGDEARDYLIINNAFGNTDRTGKASQLVASLSHVVIAHNDITQPLNLRAEIDAHSLIANNVVESWGGFRMGDEARIANNHLMANARDEDARFGKGTTRGGDKRSLFVDPSAGNFSPTGPLLAKLKPPVIGHDLNGTKRAALAPVGAVSD
ncbi:hypothetical protein GCM10011515_21580 [Tsuneonella deserti]|uniref:Right handed beta helix domain-containing protein n=1 Tax=Tsuneonella deserti TaxID=2035528 RepID=A0ABQ1S9P1_9SPHN|nr:hypothetical protein [Tsuneonella deserti]GGE01506.1 hypothetical protein GCM10011515_21580 [Tsuneonella deserti]